MLTSHSSKVALGQFLRDEYLGNILIIIIKQASTYMLESASDFPKCFFQCRFRNPVLLDKRVSAGYLADGDNIF